MLAKQEMVDKQKITKERIQTTLSKIIQLFEDGNVPQKIALATFPSFEIPSNNWSLSNRLIMLSSGTSDARTFQQWKKVGRSVKRGEKAFYILAPRMVKKNKQKTEEKQLPGGDNNKTEETEEYIMVGFIPIPVFKVEQTEGVPLKYEKMELLSWPLLEKAREWGIEVKNVPFHGIWYGCYQDGKEEKIRMATPEEIVFFHELSHAAHRRICGKLKGGQDPRQEIVAELSAQVLAHLLGTKVESTLGNSFEYIQHYARGINKDVGKACLGVLADVEKVVKLILGVKEVLADANEKS